MLRPAVLIADDEESICFVLSREAQRQGLTPMVAPDGGRAMTLAATAEGQLVAAILDVRMPVLDGVTAAVTLRAEQPELKVAVMTAFDDTALDRLPPAVQLFRKPFDLSAFSTWLAGLLEAANDTK